MRYPALWGPRLPLSAHFIVRIQAATTAPVSWRLNSSGKYKPKATGRSQILPQYNLSSRQGSENIYSKHQSYIVLQKQTINNEMLDHCWTVQGRAVSDGIAASQISHLWHWLSAKLEWSLFNAYSPVLSFITFLARLIKITGTFLSFSSHS